MKYGVFNKPTALESSVEPNLSCRTVAMSFPFPPAEPLIVEVANLSETQCCMSNKSFVTNKTQDF